MRTPSAEAPLYEKYGCSSDCVLNAGSAPAPVWRPVDPDIASPRPLSGLVVILLNGRTMKRPDTSLPSFVSRSALPPSGTPFITPAR